MWALVTLICQILQCAKDISSIFTINTSIKLMPPKKKADVKADKAEKLKPKASVSKSPEKSQPKAADTKLKATRSKDKVQPTPAQPEPAATRGRRSARQPSPVPDPTPPKELKSSKKSEPKADKNVKKDEVKTDKKDEPTSKVVTKPTATDNKDDDEQQIVKVVTKGGAAVDNFVIGKENFRVYQEGGKTYAVTLNLADLQENNNKFYIVQMLLNEQSGSMYVWNRWGRVGVPGQNCLKGPMTKDKAIQEYNSKVREKTGKGYREIEIKYDDEQAPKQAENQKPKKQNNVASKMDSSLVNLISLIFDVNVMNNTMKQIGYDAKKMPLGKLGQSTIKQAYNVLNKLTKAIENRSTSEYSKLSSEFYTLIPHNIGFEKMSKFILDNDEKVKEKIRMLQAISDMKITSKLLDQQGDEDTSVHDQNYKKLGCNIKSLSKTSADFKLLKEYFDNTKGGFSQVTVGDIFEVQRPTEFTSFNTSLGNNMLLWHGSRIANFVGILSQGLRIAPPEAPVSGYLFGKGIYLADLAEKSIHYCRSGSSPKALILLIEGALGNPNILLTSSYQAKQLMERNGKHSTKCHGAKAPPESCYVNFNGMIVPNGKPVPTSSGSYMGHNQFIVYNMNQARIRYIIEMNMNGS